MSTSEYFTFVKYRVFSIYAVTSGSWEAVQYGLIGCVLETTVCALCMSLLLGAYPFVMSCCITVIVVSVVWHPIEEVVMSCDVI